ncbi:MAG: HEAT repeat domain-containing protein, partial [Verrucomicrobia bacterium]|nr:HEAT repeat domain-containing protein [Verrucomicrobiota bacterium]
DESMLPKLLPCVHDVSPDVRLLAIQAFGVIANAKKGGNKGGNIDCTFVKPLMDHPHVETAIAANWLTFVTGTSGDRSVARDKLKKLILSKDQHIALTAASSLSATGAQGVALAREMLERCDDSLVRINLAAYLIWQRQQYAAQVIAEELSTLSDRLSWQSCGIFTYVAAGSVTHAEAGSETCETVDLLTRLDLYSMVATCEYPGLQAILKSYLRDCTWGVSGQAASIMVQEGMQTLDGLRDLLTDPSPVVSLQAAFILAFYSQDAEALSVLLQHYPKASRAMKERILYAVASIGSSDALPFLVQTLDEPFEVLRIAAARAILLLKT